MGFGYLLVETMMKTIGGRMILKYASRVSDWVRDWWQRIIYDEVTIDEIECLLSASSGTPAPLHIDFKISSRAAIDLEISALNLRVGYSAGELTIRNFVWSTAISSDPPTNITLNRIEAKRDCYQQLEFVLPPYLYFEDGGRRLYVDGTITFDTPFGAIEYPVDEHVEITSNDVADVTDTREFFRDRTARPDVPTEETNES